MDTLVVVHDLLVHCVDVQAQIFNNSLDRAKHLQKVFCEADNDGHCRNL